MVSFFFEDIVSRCNNLRIFGRTFLADNIFPFLRGAIKCSREINEFRLQARYYIHFQTNILRKISEPRYPSKRWVKYDHSCSSKKIASALNNPRKMICHKTKKPNLFLEELFVFYQFFFLLIFLVLSHVCRSTLLISSLKYSHHSHHFSSPLTSFLIFFYSRCWLKPLVLCPYIAIIRSDFVFFFSTSGRTNPLFGRVFSRPSRKGTEASDNRINYPLIQLKPLPREMVHSGFSLFLVTFYTALWDLWRPQASCFSSILFKKYLQMSPPIHKLQDTSNTMHTHTHAYNLDR